MLRFVEQKQKFKELSTAGISIGEIHDPMKSRPVLMCLIRALLIFMACFGTTDGFCSCFAIPYDHVQITLFIVAISIFMGFLYLNKLTFYVGYVILLGGFTLELIRYYLYANSGFQAIVNILREEYSNHFDLDIMRQAEEFYENRYITVTIALYFLIIFLALLLNVTISRYMNLVETILVTFIFLEIPLYIGIIPPAADMILLLGCYISVGLLKAGTQFRITIGNKHSHEFIRFKWRNKRSYFYQGNARSSILIIAFSFIFSALIMLFGAGTYDKSNSDEETNAFKEKTDEYIKTLVQVGMSGWFDRYSSVGGLSSGHLGGVSSVRPDFETDLIVSFVPKSDKTVYLREFKGSFYTNNNWYSDALYQEIDGSYTNFLESSQIDEYDDYVYANSLLNSNVLARMEIVNVDGAINHYFLPYRTVFDNISYVDKNSPTGFSPIPSDRRYAVFPRDRALNVFFSPLTEDSYPVPAKKAMIPYNYGIYVNDYCTTVPPELNMYLFTFCRDKDYFDLDITLDRKRGYIYSDTMYSDVNEFRLEACRSIYQMFVRDYPYTLSPGTTPKNEDFVKYFLEYQKRGFCAHFAASSVMILRHLGIPARYVEGYCIPTSLVRESGVPVDANKEHWYINGDEINETGVVSVEVSDYYAHAWIEVYLEGYGFIPVEMTPPSYEAMPSPSASGGLAGLFASLMSVDLDLGITGGGNTPSSNQSTVGGGSITEVSIIDGSTIVVPVLVVLLAVGLVLGVYMLIVLTAPGRHLRSALKKQDYAGFIYIHFEELVKDVKKKKLTDAENPLPMEVFTILSEHFEEKQADFDKSKLMETFEFIERILYSPANTDIETCKAYAEDMKMIRKLLSQK